MKINLSKKVWIPLVVVAGLLIAFAIIFPSLYCTVLSVDLKIAAVQVDESQNIHVTWDTSKPVNKVTIGVYHDGKLVREYTTTKFAESADIEAFYGRMEVKVTVKKGIYTTSKTTKVNLSASEYNIAPLTATMPVTLFSLSLANITNEGEIPTFVWFKRSGAWDWKNLPENVYAMPIANGKAFLNSNEEKMYKETTKWIRELYEINKESKFHLFYNDYFAYGWVQATVGNGIPTENYDVKLITDGTASIAYFNKHFNNANAQTNYDAMAQKWETLKSQVAKKGSYNKKSKFAIDAGTLREYAAVMAMEEENVEWWLSTGLDARTTPNNSDFASKVMADDGVKALSMSDLMKSIPGYITDPDHPTDSKFYVEGWENKWMNVDKIKKLYHFSDNMFEKATEEGKKIMIILGTWSTTAPNEPNLEQYTKAIMAYYGDEYVYYYKGHPKYPTNSIDGKLGQLNKMGLIDVDSTIAAELIYFFNPDAYFCGYDSSTFITVDAEHTCGVFNQRNGSYSPAYKNKVDFTVSMAVTSGIEIEGVTFDLNSVLFEFNKSAEGVEAAEYDIALYHKGQLKFYKNNGGNYVEVA